MTIAILDVAHYPPHLMNGEPKFGEEQRAWLQRGLDYPMDVIDVQGGASLPEVDDYEGFVVGGSEKGVYDEVWWMAPMSDLVLMARDQGKPLLGICFGHQFLAQAFGGHAELSDKGKQCGVRSYEVNGRQTPAHVWHQDQVTQQPPGSQVFAAADYCPIGGLAYDFPAMSVQFHPETRRAYLGGFLDRARGEIFEDAETDRILAELRATEVPEDLWAAEAGAFFAKHLRGAEAA